MDAHRIQPVGGLVEDEKGRAADEGSRKAQPLLHAEGVFLCRAISEPGQACQLQGVLHSGGLKPKDAADQVQIFPACQIAVEGGLFDEGAGLSQNLHPVPGVGHPVNGECADCGAHKPQEHFHGGGLSGPVWPEKSVYSSLPYMKVQPVDGCEISVSLCQFMCLDDRFHSFVCLLCLSGSIVPGHPYRHISSALHLPYKEGSDGVRAWKYGIMTTSWSLYLRIKRFLRNRRNPLRICRRPVAAVRPWYNNHTVIHFHQKQSRKGNENYGHRISEGQAYPSCGR